MWKRLAFVCFCLCSIGLLAQPEANWVDQSLPWRNIGPANMMGRIAAVEALSTDYRQVLVGSASGGVYKSENAGVTWDVIFDTYGVCSIGSVAFSEADPNVIWVGTGESANRNSSGWGNGLFKSEDGGNTFRYVGLQSTHHIAEIATHPTDPKVAYAATIGHLWGYAGDRGLYKTSDGGMSWEKLTEGLPDDSKTGCTEIIMHPENPDILFAGFYQRLRQPYHYQSGGEIGGIFKSEDGGKSWRKITKGLPTGSTGMIDIAFHLKDPQIMVAAVEADEDLAEDVPGSGVYRSDDGGESWTFLLEHHVRPFYHGQIEIDPIDPKNIYVVSRDFRISKDGGKTFKPRRWYTDGGDDHDMWIAPYDNKIMYLATDQGLRLTVDGGKNFMSLNNMAIGQYYAIGVDMRDPYWVIGGLQDNGIWMLPSNSRERRGITNRDVTWVGEGDGFHAQIDPTDYRNLYIVNHVGFAARLNFETREYEYITPTPETVVNLKDYVDPNFDETHTIYTIEPGEHWFYYEYADRPKMPPQFRFNWSSPLVLSPSNPHTIYFGSNFLFKSIDQGKSWRIISPDLTTNDPTWRNPSKSGGLTTSVTGGENHYTIITIAESPINEAVVWVGTDDGNVQITRDGGVNWENVKLNIPDIPEKIWVSRVEPSHHTEGTCYVTFDNHRYDDFKPYIFKTEDYGKTWTNISSDLPDGFSLYVVCEDPIAPNLLFVGSENAVHTTIDGGKTWMPLMNNMPTVAVHDLIIHPRDADLIAGTHGRSIWILDDITPLRQLSKENLEKELHLFDGRVGTKWQRIFVGRSQPAFEFRGANPRSGAYLNFYVKEAAQDSAIVTVQEFVGDRTTSFKLPVKQGLNRTYWNFIFPPTEADISNYHEHLKGVIKSLEQEISRTDLLKIINEIKEELREAKTVDAMNEVRKHLVDDFALYAGGKSFFGKKLTPTSAEPGKYPVTIKLGEVETSNVIEVRNDPILDKHGWKSR